MPMQSHTERFGAHRITRIALLTAMALAVQWLESLLPAPVPGVPVRLGLANVFTLYALSEEGRMDALLISLLRCILFSLVTGNVSQAAYSLAGSIFSVLGMLLLSGALRREAISLIGLSMAGAFLFNLGQLTLGLFLAGKAMIAYLPLMGLLSIPSGAVTGLIVALLAPRLRKAVRHS